MAVVKDWSISDQGYFAYTQVSLRLEETVWNPRRNADSDSEQTLSLTLFAILAGFWQLAFRRTKVCLNYCAWHKVVRNAC